MLKVVIVALLYSMKPDQQRVSDVVVETVMKLCASGLEGTTARVQGVIGVTVDNTDIFLIHINDTVRSLSASLRQIPDPRPESASSARKRACHRLVFESPSNSRHGHSESSEGLELKYSNSSQSELNNSANVSLHQTEQPRTMSDFDPISDDVKPNPNSAEQMLQTPAKASVIVVDSDEEEMKPVFSEGLAACRKSPVDSSVSRLRIADVVGSVPDWSVQSHAGQTHAQQSHRNVAAAAGNKDDGDDFAVMEEFEVETSHPQVKPTPPRSLQVTSPSSVHAVGFVPYIHFISRFIYMGKIHRCKCYIFFYFI